MKKMHSSKDNNPILRVITLLLTPLIALYGIYIQLNGEYSPGGGFQAGVILAVPLILLSLFLNAKIITTIISMSFLRIIAAFGVLIYAGTGILAIFFNKNFLDYSVFGRDSGQKLGIFFVELGVGMTVFATIVIIYFSFAVIKND